MSKIDEDEIKALAEHPKAYQILNHLSSLGIKDAQIDIQVNVDRSWIFLAINEPIVNVLGIHQEAIFQTTINFVEGQLAFIHGTYVGEKYQGKGVYGLACELRDRILEKAGVLFMSSMIRNDNSNMQKAALKDGWKKSFVGDNHSIFIKEVRHETIV